MNVLKVVRLRKIVLTLCTSWDLYAQTNKNKDFYFFSYKKNQLLECLVTNTVQKRPKWSKIVCHGQK